MGGNDQEESKKSKRFPNFRNVFKPRTRGTPNEPHDLISVKYLPSSFPNARADPQIRAHSLFAAPGSSTQPQARLAPMSETHTLVASESLETGKAEMTSAEARQSTPRSYFVVPVDSYGDRKATEERYKTAAKKLEEALKCRRANWKAFDIPTVSLDISTNDPIPLLREQIQSTLEARKTLVENRDFWTRAKGIVERSFTAMSPFAKNFLAIAEHGANVLAFQ